jgi:hypothetical protein
MNLPISASQVARITSVSPCSSNWLFLIQQQTSL